MSQIVPRETNCPVYSLRSNDSTSLLKRKWQKKASRQIKTGQIASVSRETCSADELFMFHVKHKSDAGEIRLGKRLLT
jgi:hypothetical protein